MQTMTRNASEYKYFDYILCIETGSTSTVCETCHFKLGYACFCVSILTVFCFNKMIYEYIFDLNE